MDSLLFALAIVVFGIFCITVFGLAVFASPTVAITAIKSIQELLGGFLTGRIPKDLYRAIQPKEYEDTLGSRQEQGLGNKHITSASKLGTYLVVVARLKHNRKHSQQ